MRVFLVIMDETEEARASLRFATRRAAAVDGMVHILALVPQQNVSAFGAVQATIEQEARDRAEMLAHGAAGNIFSECGIMPAISVRVGSANKVIHEFLEEHQEVAALVLGAAGNNNPGPLVSHFSANAGSLTCPLYIVPKDYEETDVDR
ncbi:MAG TPA: universal stress protein [Erythrobacter sp.]|nr:universal stress protein [Erythrobacter sp.]